MDHLLQVGMKKEDSEIDFNTYMMKDVLINGGDLGSTKNQEEVPCHKR